MNKIPSGSFLRYLIRFVVYTIVSLIVLWILNYFMDSFNMLSWQAGVVAIVVISLLNTFLRPLLVRWTIGLTMMTFGLFSLIISVIIVWLTSRLVAGFEVNGFFPLLVVSFGLAFAHTFVSNLLLAREDRELDRLRVIKRFARKADDNVPTTPGMIILEVDGLSEPILRKALDEGRMPTLKRWIDSGSHTLVGWEASVPSMTSAMQAGILHGSHKNIPAFRFYDKKQKRLLVSNHPKDAGEILAPNNNGHGLLHVQGLSVNNWTSGNAPDSLLTFTDMASKDKTMRQKGDLLYGFFADAYLMQQAVSAMFVDMWHEWKESHAQVKENVLPRIVRHFPYPIVRAATVAFLPAISVYLVIEKMFEGVGAVYTTLVSYDEVAHHSGIDRPDAMLILEAIDEQVRWVEEAKEHAARPYEIVMLSDHGQSMGATFKQRYNKTISELISELITESDGDGKVVNTETGDEGLQFLGLLLSQVSSGSTMRAKIVESAVKKRESGGYVEMEKPEDTVSDKEAEEAESVVCASGNLALVFFKASDERMTLEEILARYPRLLPGLAAHPGIGVLLVKSEVAGLVAMGKDGGIYQLETGEITEPNPLANYSERTPGFLRDLAAYDNVGDLVLFSTYDPVTSDVGAFEELVGHHGGIGGWQTHPFLLYPTHFHEGPPPQIHGAGEVYQQLMRWKEKIGLIEPGTVTFEKH